LCFHAKRILRVEVLSSSKSVPWRVPKIAFPSILPMEIAFHSDPSEKGRDDIGVELRAGAAEHLGNGIFETP
jgi:hypothetical protein